MAMPDVEILGMRSLRGTGRVGVGGCTTAVTDFLFACSDIVAAYDVRYSHRQVAVKEILSGAAGGEYQG